MKIALFGISEIKLGKHNLKDPRLDQADKLVEADKKTHAQVDVIGEDQLLEADGILALAGEQGGFDPQRPGVRGDPPGPRPAAGGAGGAGEDQGAARKRALPLQLGLERGGPAGGRGAQLLHQQADHRGGARGTAEPRRAAPARLRGCRLHLVPDRRRQGKPRLADSQRAPRPGKPAGTIHTDIQKGFIRAEIISFADFIAAGGETQAKRAGKQRLELKQYVVQDYDLVNFRFNK